MSEQTGPILAAVRKELPEVLRGTARGELIECLAALQDDNPSAATAKVLMDLLNDVAPMAEVPGLDPVDEVGAARQRRRAGG